MNRKLYGQAYEDGFRSTLRFLAIRGISPEAAEEIAQAAWTRGWERRQQLRDPGLVQPWVNRIAINLLRNDFRTVKPTALPEQLPSQRRPNNDAAIDVDSLLRRCRQCDRTLLERYYLEGCTTVEIANQDRLNHSTVRVKLMRAKDNLRRKARIRRREEQRRTQHVAKCKRT